MSDIETAVVRHTTEKLLIAVGEIAREKKCSVLEAAIIYMEQYELEPEELAKLVTGPLRDKIKEEAIDLKMIKGSSDRLLA